MVTDRNLQVFKLHTEQYQLMTHLTENPAFISSSRLCLGLDRFLGAVCPTVRPLLCFQSNSQS